MITYHDYNYNLITLILDSTQHDPWARDITLPFDVIDRG